VEDDSGFHHSHYISFYSFYVGIDACSCFYFTYKRMIVYHGSRNIDICRNGFIQNVSYTSSVCVQWIDDKEVHAM